MWIHLYAAAEIVARKMNYFKILKIPIAYNIDVDLMTRNYFSLQRRSENFVDSGLLNEAYNVLKNDIRSIQRTMEFIRMESRRSGKAANRLRTGWTRCFPSIQTTKRSRWFVMVRLLKQLPE